MLKFFSVKLNMAIESIKDYNKIIKKSKEESNGKY